MVQRHSAMLSFTDVFRDLAVLFVLLVPLLFLMKSPRTGKGPVAMH
jgi:hypothetical protein